ncbi:MAG: 3'(2'),5'-bisphosphate nucleotidase CysQ [Pseudomonadota bacterium]|jgi:3'(2'), 5'-bisphosphate nucleotidase|nr:3'(2'),5'-bisphosphate nucleotidase CysQ [Xanthomonadaceae bacterium]MDE2248343.1 3'(2'),5'-bisphosphate nucleotidase CysQ [Xanthomonadaceae bacterium]MDE3211466.1 3'(2'),5'-bisphosphate nucleotidase CysQ [Pseudomonadota bacterium]
MTTPPEFARQIGGIARAAGDAILAVYHGDFAVQTKDDASPLTAADLAAQQVIVAGLGALDPRLPILSEEAKALDWSERRHWSRYWLVDPLDGTREFIKRNGEFTVNIALIDQGRSVLGAVLAPVTGELYLAEQGRGAWLQQQPGGTWQRLRSRPLAQPPTVAGSRSHGGGQGSLLEQLIGANFQMLPLGSSLKFCLIARGIADVYLRLGLTSEWDTAAAQCVLDEAGGAVLDLAGRPFRYNRGESLLNPEFIAIGDSSIDWAARLTKAGVSGEE